MTVKEITNEWLKANGYDGLWIDDCRCLVDDLMPCSGCAQVEGCEAGYLHADKMLWPDKETP